MTRRAAFKQADAERALRAALAAGMRPSSCTIAPDGSIKVEFDEAGKAPRNPWDKVLES